MNSNEFDLFKIDTKFDTTKNKKLRKSLIYRAYLKLKVVPTGIEPISTV